MDADRFDSFTRELTRFVSRRRLLGAVGSGLAVPPLARTAAAADRGAGRRRNDRDARRDENGRTKPHDKPTKRVAERPTNRIHGGTPVPQGTYTFAAAIRSATSSCSGSLIDPSHVLTAAHCTHSSTTHVPHPLSSYTVVVGQVDRLSTSCAGCLKRVTSVAIDPRYVPSNNSSAYDVAVLTLDSPVAATIARPIALVGVDQANLAAPDQIVTVAGWGLTNDGQPLPRNLMQAQLRVIPNSACGRDPATYVCTSHAEGRQTCSGDSGGPVFVDAGGFVQVAVVTGGTGGCPSVTAAPRGVSARLSNPEINSFVRANAPGAGPQPPGPPGPPDTTPPTVSATAPASVKKGQPFTISVTATDSVGIADVELFDCTDGGNCTLLDTATSAPYDFGQTLFASGVHLFVARATDTAGNSAESEDIWVKVQKKRR